MLLREKNGLRNSKFNDKQRFIFVGRYYFSSTIEEIARQAGTTPSNIYKALEKIKRGLKSYLESNGVNV